MLRLAAILCVVTKRITGFSQLRLLARNSSIPLPRYLFDPKEIVADARLETAPKVLKSAANATPFDPPTSLGTLERVTSALPLPEAASLS
jgi:hypothetical protein